jgi:hypothetical protein
MITIFPLKHACKLVEIETIYESCGEHKNILLPLKLSPKESLHLETIYESCGEHKNNCYRSNSREGKFLKGELGAIDRQVIHYHLN